MERSLDPELLALALGDHERLPSVEEFTDALETAELGILQGEERLADTVFPTAWLLHAIASSDEAKQLYGPDRQRAAFRVSAHAFDLILQQDEHDWIDRAQLCFAAQIAYLRSKFDPNAVAVYERELSSDLAEPDILRNPTRYSLSCATALLAFDTDYFFEATADIREHLDAVTEQFGVNRIGETPFGAAGNLIAGCRHLLVFLVYGRKIRLNGARTRFQQAIHSDGATGDRASRWAAAHLLNLLQSGLADKSIWRVLPPDVPPSIRKAFTLAPPKILTLWPPQLDLLNLEDEDEGRSPFSADNDRQLITMPTSGGKTLFSHLIIAVQLARAERDVCYVAPTRSLCREVRRDLNKRLRFVSRTGADHSQQWLDTELTLEGGADVEVMTPERLSYLLRGNAQAVLDRFGLFVFDEVHTVDDDERGWTLEQDLSYIHHATQNTDHRILLMSAAVGNQPHFVSWMGGEPHVSQPDTEWQATRRVHSIYTTRADWEEAKTEKRESKDYPILRTVPLEGLWKIRGAEGQIREIPSDEYVGYFVRRESIAGEGDEVSQSTPNYEKVIPLINHLGDLGPVLTIHADKRRTRWTAEALAEEQPQDQTLLPELEELIELVNTRLGSDHPLSEVLDRGVAYHHGKLPSEIRNGIEDAVSSEALQYVVATTTMTEGVNLPVRSVVIASQGAHGEDGYDEYIVGSRLLNAIGRAGRAAKETEGIVVLARFTRNPEEDFDRLDPGREELRADSWLAKPEALENLAQFEEMAREAEDVVMQAGADTETDAVSSFLSFVWFIAAELERLERPRTPEEVADWLESTLAWVQLDEETQERWSRVAEQALERYEETDVASRRRWSRSGTSVNTAARLDNLAEEVAEELIATEEEITSWTDLIMFLLGDGRLSRILEASDSSGIEVRSRRARGGEEINLDLLALVRDWLEGAELNTIAGGYLAGVEQTDYRFQQLGELVYEVFEIHLPWMLRVLVDWTNEHLEARNLSPALPDEIPSLVRWGVPDPTAAKLMDRGIGSRRLAIQITEEWREADPEVGVEEWVRNLPRADWRERFDATVAELRNLVSILRPQSDETLLPFLNGESITVPIQEIEGGTIEPGERAEVPRPSEEWAPIEITQGDESVGMVEGGHTQDVMAILQMGVRLRSEIDLKDGSPILRLTPLEPNQPLG